MGARGRVRRTAAGVEQRQAARPAPVAVLEPPRRRVRRVAREAGEHPSAHPRARSPSGRAPTSRSPSRCPIAEQAPPFTQRTTWDEGIALAKLLEEFGYDSVTPVWVSVFPDATLARGGIPRSLWKNKAMSTRFRDGVAQPGRPRGAEAGYVWGGMTARFQPVWNRSRFIATKAAVSIPVLAVGGIRDTHEVDEILDGGQADLVGIGRPVLRRARPGRADPRRPTGARAVPVLEPVRARPDARDEGRLLQPRRHQGSPRG